MIVDAIQKYLSGDGAAVPAEILAEVGRLASYSFQRQFGQREDKPGTLRLSGIGKCLRAQAYNLLGFPINGKEIDARSKMVFFQGDIVELAVVELARLAGLQISACGPAQMSVELDGVSGHPDGILTLPDGEKVLVECKSMSSFGFREFEAGKVDETYVAQYNSYLEALGLRRVCVVAMNKDSGILQERVFEKDPAVVADIFKRIKILRASTKDNLPPRPYAPDAKGFYSWRCLYCSFHDTCLPNAEKVLVNKKYKLKERSK